MLETVELTPRQLEFLALSAQGKSRKEIAAIVYVSHWTVKLTLDNARDRLEVKNLMTAVLKAIAMGILVLDDDGAVHISHALEPELETSTTS